MDLALFQESNGFSVKNTLRFYFLSLSADLVKPLELDEPSLDLDHFLESDKLLLPLPLKLPLLPFGFLKLGVNVVPFPLRSPMLELLETIAREEVERHKEFLAPTFCKAIMDKYLPVCLLVIKFARREPFFVRLCTCIRRP